MQLERRKKKVICIGLYKKGYFQNHKYSKKHYLFSFFLCFQNRKFNHPSWWYQLDFFAHSIMAWNYTFVVSFMTWLGPSPILCGWREKRLISQKPTKFCENFWHKVMKTFQNPTIMLNNSLFSFKNWKQNVKIPSGSKVIDISLIGGFSAIFSVFSVIRWNIWWRQQKMAAIFGNFFLPFYLFHVKV